MRSVSATIFMLVGASVLTHAACAPVKKDGTSRQTVVSVNRSGSASEQSSFHAKSLGEVFNHLGGVAKFTSTVSGSCLLSNDGQVACTTADNSAIGGVIARDPFAGVEEEVTIVTNIAVAGDLICALFTSGETYCGSMSDGALPVRHVNVGDGITVSELAANFYDFYFLNADKVIYRLTPEIWEAAAEDATEVEPVKVEYLWNHVGSATRSFVTKRLGSQLWGDAFCAVVELAAVGQPACLDLDTQKLQLRNTGISAKNVDAVYAGKAACARVSLGAASGNEYYCWGDNTGGLLPSLAKTEITSPTLTTFTVTGVGGEKNITSLITQLALGKAIGCGMTEEGLAYCWGDAATAGFPDEETEWLDFSFALSEDPEVVCFTDGETGAECSDE